MKTKKIMIAFIVFIVLEIIAASVYAIAIGNRFNYHTGVYLESQKTPKIEVSFEKNGIVTLEKAYLDNHELVLTFSSVGNGETDAYVKHAFTGNDSMIELPKCHFTVNVFGFITFNNETCSSFEGYRAIVILILVVLFETTVFMVWRFFYHFRHGTFSHLMIACGGIGIYTFVLWLFLTYKLLNNVIRYFSELFIYIFETGQILLLLLTLPMLILSVALAVSNIWLMRNEGYRPVNTLGIIFAVFWFIGTMLTLGASELNLFSDFHYYYLIQYTLKYILIYIIGYFECVFLSTVVCTYLATKYKTPYDRDYIIILGCAIRRDGTLTPLLKGRVDSAVLFENRQFEKTGKHAVFVPSGGQGADEVISEGEAMENYLLDIGIPGDQILREDQSTNTFQNMQFSKKVIEQHAKDFKQAKIAFSTTNYHVFRGYVLAQKNGFDAKGISAKTRVYFYFNAFLREFIGLLVDKKWLHIAFVLSTIAVFLINAFVISFH